MILCLPPFLSVNVILQKELRGMLKHYGVLCISIWTKRHLSALHFTAGSKETMTPTVIFVSFLTVLIGGVTSVPSLKTLTTTVSHNVTYTQTSLATRSVRTGLKRRTTNTSAKISPTKVSKFSETVKATRETTRGLKPMTFKPTEGRTKATTPTTKPSKPTKVITKTLKTTTVKPTAKTTPKTTPLSFQTEDLNDNIDKSVERRVWNPKNSEEPPVFGKKWIH